MGLGARQGARGRRSSRSGARGDVGPKVESVHGWDWRGRQGREVRGGRVSCVKMEAGRRYVRRPGAAVGVGMQLQSRMVLKGFVLAAVSPAVPCRHLGDALLAERHIPCMLCTLGSSRPSKAIVVGHATAIRPG